MYQLPQETIQLLKKINEKFPYPQCNKWHLNGHWTSAEKASDMDKPLIIGLLEGFIKIKNIACTNPKKCQNPLKRKNHGNTETNAICELTDSF